MGVGASLAEEARLDPEIVPSTRGGCTRLGEASSVDLLPSYSILKPHTVGGTREVTKFACHAKTKPVHHVSS